MTFAALLPNHSDRFVFLQPVSADRRQVELVELVELAALDVLHCKGIALAQSRDSYQGKQCD